MCNDTLLVAYKRRVYMLLRNKRKVSILTNNFLSKRFSVNCDYIKVFQYEEAVAAV